MKLMMANDLRDHATKALNSREPLIIMRRGEFAGIFSPVPVENVPVELMKDLLITLTDSIKKRVAGIKKTRSSKTLKNIEKAPLRSSKLLT